MTPSLSVAPKPWTCAAAGFATALDRATSQSVGPKDKEIWWTIFQSITQLPIIM